MLKWIAPFLLIGAAMAAPLTRDCPDGAAWVWNDGVASCAPSAALPAAPLTVACAADGATWTFVNGRATCTPPAATSACQSGDIKITGRWGDSAIETAPYGAFANNVLAVEIAPPANWSGTSVRVSSWVEYGSGPTVRYAALSTVPCDFSTNVVSNAYGKIIVTNNNRPSFNYRPNTSSGTAAGLVPGQKYYWNMKNAFPDGSPSCTISDCTMRGSIDD